MVTAEESQCCRELDAHLSGKWDPPPYTWCAVSDSAHRLWGLLSEPIWATDSLYALQIGSWTSPGQQTWVCLGQRLNYWAKYLYVYILGVCDIYSLQQRCVVLTMCNLTISCILQKPNKTPTESTHTLACVVMNELNSTRAHLECSFTAWFSRLKCIKNDRKIQDIGAENL